MNMHDTRVSWKIYRRLKVGIIFLTLKKKKKEKKNVIDYFEVDRTRATNDSFVQRPTFFSDDDSDDGVLSFEQRGRRGSEIFVSISNGSLTG